MKDLDSKCNPNKKPTRPVLRYHGGKWKIAPWVISFFPPHSTYVEPFGGSASVLIRKEPANHEVYNDLDDELVNMFQVLRTRGKQLLKQLRMTPFSRTEFNNCFLPSGNQIERARKAIFRSMAGYGTAGFNRQTGFSTAAKGRSGGRQHEWNRLPDALPAVIERFKKVVIENRPAIDVMTYHDSADTLHYLDPPYMFCTRDSGSDYKHELTDDGHRELCECALSLQGAVIISGYDTPLYRKMFRGWKRHTRVTHCQSNEERTECLWVKPS